MSLMDDGPDYKYDKIKIKNLLLENIIGVYLR